MAALGPGASPLHLLADTAAETVDARMVKFFLRAAEGGGEEECQRDAELISLFAVPHDRQDIARRSEMFVNLADMYCALAREDQETDRRLHYYLSLVLEGLRWVS